MHLYSFLMNSEYYEILGITPNATFAEIKSVYRSHAANLIALREKSDEKTHAMLSQELEKLTEVYNYLRSPLKRAIYNNLSEEKVAKPMIGNEGSLKSRFTGTNSTGERFR